MMTRLRKGKKKKKEKELRRDTCCHFERFVFFFFWKCWKLRESEIRQDGALVGRDWDDRKTDKFEWNEVKWTRIDEKIYDASLKFGQIVRCLVSGNFSDFWMELLIEDLIEGTGCETSYKLCLLFEVRRRQPFWRRDESIGLDKTIGFLEEYSSTIVYDPFFELSRRKMKKKKKKGRFERTNGRGGIEKDTRIRNQIDFEVICSRGKPTILRTITRILYDWHFEIRLAND